MTEEKARYSTVPADLNELKAHVEADGGDWNEALARLKEATGGKDLASAMRDGWTAEDFWKTLTSDSASSAPQAEPDPAPTPKPPPPPPTNNDQHFTEAPASFNVKAISPAGFDVMLTLRDSDSRQLMKRALGALDWLVKKGFAPTPARGGNRGGNGPGAESGDKPKYCTHKSDGPGFCPTHGKELKQSKHHSGYYCPTKL